MTAPGRINRLADVKFKTGLTVGVAVGYVLGARAGRDRYEQIKRASVAASRHPAVGQLGRQVTGLTDLVRTGLAGGLEAGSRGMRVVAETTPESPEQISATRR